MNCEHFTKIELKYCEMCGGLWLRKEGNHGVYCAHCAPTVTEIAHGAKKKPVFVDLAGVAGGPLCA
jgi:Zn-finger nucleic acid-binding protein